MKYRTNRRGFGNVFGCASGCPFQKVSFGALIVAFSCALLLTSMANLAVAKDKDVPVLKKGIEN